MRNPELTLFLALAVCLAGVIACAWVIVWMCKRKD